MKKIIIFLFYILLPQTAGLIGSMFTRNSINNWYQFLIKPALNPPNWIFAPVWTLLYIFMGVAAYLIWLKGWQNKKVRIALIIFFLQLVLNSIWSIIFFGMQNILFALIELMILWTLILIITIMFFRIEKKAGYLMLPYLIWTSFAMYLNYMLLILN